ncbi:outer membrane protein [Candidatus Photodesmus katoptron]|uniref:TolC family outer membrane protein n=1 Tax=Candidatus Photodesmus anomalopis TaxID=28176 RepID=UPI0004D46675|nr:TolC family outer membrane protein [Candidatus Photodesmus katoptron]KEY90480.1 outer membrane protein [Candidatus Photodesmus katoptron]
MSKSTLLLISVILTSLSNLVHSKDLLEIYNEAKENDPKLFSALAQRDSALEAITSSRSVFLPEIFLSSNYSRNSYSKHIRSNNIKLSQSLFKYSNFTALDIAKKIAIKKKYAYKAAQQALMIRTAEAYFSVLRAQENLKLIHSKKTIFNHQLKQARDQFKAGNASITEIQNVQAKYDIILADEIISKNNLANQYEMLSEITNQKNNNNIKVLDNKNFSANKIMTSIDELINQAKQNNLNLLMAQIDKDIARDKIALIKYENLPSAQLDFDYLLDGSEIPSPVGKQLDFNLTLHLKVPLFSGGYIASKTKQAEYDYIIASKNLELKNRKLVTHIRKLYNDITASIYSLNAYEQMIISTTSALEATKTGFNIGTHNIIDVLDSIHLLYDANKNLSNARYDYILNVLRMREITGSLNEKNILHINKKLTVKKQI